MIRMILSCTNNPNAKQDVLFENLTSQFRTEAQALHKYYQTKIGL